MRYLKHHQGIISAIIALAGLVILVYIGKVLGDRGIYADEHHTGGYTTPFELFLIFIGFSSLIYAVGLFLGSRGRHK